MKVSSRIVISTAVAGLVSLAQSGGLLSEEKGAEKGRCYGVVGCHGQGDCGGKDDTGKTWGCMGENTCAKWGYKNMTKADCEAAPVHASIKPDYEKLGLKHPSFNSNPFEKAAETKKKM